MFVELVNVSVCFRNICAMAC